MEGSGEFRCWEELIPDALGLIFSHLSLREILTVIPRVCKSWATAVSGPYCLQDIDIEEWSLQCTQENLDRMLQMLIIRSSGSVRNLCISALRDEHISSIADHFPSLQTLRIPRSFISDSIIEQVSGKLSNLTYLDISHCINIGPRALEAFGKNCKSLVRLKRTMHPILEVAYKLCHDDEANAIAATMPKLKHLELSYLHLTTAGALAILSNCRELELFDVRGCWDVKLDDEFLKKFPGLKVLGPLIVDCCKMNSWDDFSEYSDSSGGSWYYWDELQNGIEDDDGESFDGSWDDERGLDELEVRFYEGFNDTVAAGFDWPHSP